MDWEIVYYNDDVQNLVLSFPAGIQARSIHLTQRMVTFGPNLGMPHTRPLGKALFELRMKSKEGIGRAFYCSLAQLSLATHHDAPCLHQEIREDTSQGTSDCPDQVNRGANP